LAVLLVACDRAPGSYTSNDVDAEKNTKLSAKRGEFAMIVRGGQLFSVNCAECHGDLAQGHPRWQQLDVNGRYPAPPLNGTGHAWHHPKTTLV